MRCRLTAVLAIATLVAASVLLMAHLDSGYLHDSDPGVTHPNWMRDKQLPEYLRLSELSWVPHAHHPYSDRECGVGTGREPRKKDAGL